TVAVARNEAPCPLAETVEPAVQVSATLLVERQLVRAPVDRYSAFADAIGRPAGDGAKMRRVLDVILKAVEAEHQRKIDAGETNIANDGADRQNFGRQVTSRNGDFLDFSTVRQKSEALGCHRFPPAECIGQGSTKRHTRFGCKRRPSARSFGCRSRPICSRGELRRL